MTTPNTPPSDTPEATVWFPDPRSKGARRFKLDIGYVMPRMHEAPEEPDDEGDGEEPELFDFWEQ